MKENELTTGLIIQHLSLESQTLYVSQFTAAIQIVSGLGVFGFDNHEFQVTACDRFLDCIVIGRRHTCPVEITLTAGYQIPLGACTAILFGRVDLIIPVITWWVE